MRLRQVWVVVEDLVGSELGAALGGIEDRLERCCHPLLAGVSLDGRHVPVALRLSGSRLCPALREEGIAQGVGSRITVPVEVAVQVLAPALQLEGAACRKSFPPIER